MGQSLRDSSTRSFGLRYEARLSAKASTVFASHADRLVTTMLDQEAAVIMPSTVGNDYTLCKLGTYEKICSTLASLSHIQQNSLGCRRMLSMLHHVLQGLFKMPDHHMAITQLVTCLGLNQSVTSTNMAIFPMFHSSKLIMDCGDVSLLVDGQSSGAGDGSLQKKGQRVNEFTLTTSFMLNLIIVIWPY